MGSPTEPHGETSIMFYEELLGSGLEHVESWYTPERTSKGQKEAWSHSVTYSPCTEWDFFHGNSISIVRAKGARREWGEETEWSSMGIRLCVQWACKQETRQGLQDGLGFFPFPSRGTGFSEILQLLFLEVLEGFPPQVSFSSKPFSPIFLPYIRENPQAYRNTATDQFSVDLN